MNETATLTGPMPAEVGPEIRTPLSKVDDAAVLAMRGPVDAVFIAENSGAKPYDYDEPKDAIPVEASYDDPIDAIPVAAEQADITAEAATGRKISLVRRLGRGALIRAKVEAGGLLVDISTAGLAIAGVPGMTLGMRETIASGVDVGLYNKLSKGEQSAEIAQISRARKLAHKAGHTALMFTAAYMGAKYAPEVAHHISSGLSHGHTELATQMVGKVAGVTSTSAAYKRVLRH